MAKKTKQIKSFADLSSLKKKVNILDENQQPLFYLEELSGEDIEKIVSQIINHVSSTQGETLVEEKESGKISLDLTNDMIIFLLRQMVKDLQIDSMTDEEIKNTWKTMGHKIRTQIDKALYDLALQEIMTRMQEYFKYLVEQNKKLEEAIKAENQAVI